jgi:membrane protein DedA with SNARE-associated domain
MPVILAANATTTWWIYPLLFLGVMAAWAGVPFVGTLALGAAGVAASQGRVTLVAVVVVSTVAGEVGGLIGYWVGFHWVGFHWGRQLLGRPGKRLASREKALERGERLYSRWGRLAVFVTPAIVSGTAKMKRGQFLLWNLVASFAFSVSVGASSYGLGRIATGHHSRFDIGVLVAGLVAGVLFLFLGRRRRRKVASTPHAA